MLFLIYVLTFFMVLNCLLLVMLVLIQLPKKEAGAGLAFGGSASDALFGAGSGTVLTKITRWAATAFFILAVVLGLMQKHYYGGGATQFQRSLAQPARPVLPPAMPSPSATHPTPSTAGGPTPLTSSNMLLMPTPEATNAPAAPAASPAATNTAPH